jgi:hypothetical protein
MPNMASRQLHLDEVERHPPFCGAPSTRLGVIRAPIPPTSGPAARAALADPLNAYCGQAARSGHVDGRQCLVFIDCVPRKPPRPSVAIKNTQSVDDGNVCVNSVSHRVGLGRD